MTTLVSELSTTIGVSAACRQLEVPRGWYYRRQAAQTGNVQKSPAARPRPTPAHALSQAEKEQLRAVLNSERFMDQPPREVYATLLDEEQYLCHWRTMYRVLAEHQEVRERRRLRQHPTYSQPQLRATGPNQVWSWDITRLYGLTARVFYYLYLILDIYSRYIVGWTVVEQESAALAREFVAITCHKQQIAPEQLTLHSDRGSPMRAQTMAELLIKLGVAKSHSRPYTPNDNPFSEAQFKTLKERPDYPGQFASLAEARQWTRGFVGWYNNEHHHVALRLMTPAVVHYGQAEQVRLRRQQVLDAAYARHPERFKNGPPQAAGAPPEVWINPPADTAFLDTAGKDTQPGAQPGSRVGIAALEAGEHLATIGPLLWPVHEKKSSLILIGDLSHNA
jgi:putative transposase